MTRYKVTMTPDSSGWEPTDLRAVAGFHLGLWQEFTDPKKAYECMENAAGLGWSVALEHVEDDSEHVAG
jgi:hypothetical protein